MMADKKIQFEQLAPQRRTSVFREYIAFLAHNKKWWLLPILIILLATGLLLLLSSSAIAPFIYPLF